MHDVLASSGMADAIHPVRASSTTGAASTPVFPRELAFYTPTWGKALAIAAVCAWILGLGVQSMANAAGTSRESCYYLYPNRYSNTPGTMQPYYDCLQERYAKQVDGYRMRQLASFLASSGRLGLSAVLVLVGFLVPNPKYARILLVGAGAFLLTGGLVIGGSAPSYYAGSGSYSSSASLSSAEAAPTDGS